MSPTSSAVALPRPARDTRPRLGFLGVGWIGKHRLQAIHDSGQAQVVALADPLVEAAQTAERELRLENPPRVMTDLEALLACEDLDGIVIATPSALHAEQSIRALERGRAVFCQKPLGRTASETKAVVDAARKADRLLGVDLSYRFVRGMPQVRELVQSGELGEVYAVDLVFHNAYGPDKAWFYDPKLSGGGCVMDLGIHLVDLALWALPQADVTGTHSRLFAGGRPLHRVQQDTPQVEDYAEAQLELSSGAVVRLTCSWRAHAGRDAVIEAAFYGTKGGAALRNVNGSFYDFTVERFRGTSRETLASPPDAWGGRAAVDWAERLGRDGGRFDPEAEHLVKVADALDRIYAR